GLPVGDIAVPPSPAAGAAFGVVPSALPEPPHATRARARTAAPTNEIIFLVIFLSRWLGLDFLVLANPHLPAPHPAPRARPRARSARARRSCARRPRSRAGTPPPHRRDARASRARCRRAGSPACSPESRSRAR